MAVVSILHLGCSKTVSITAPETKSPQIVPAKPTPPNKTNPAVLSITPAGVYDFGSVPLLATTNMSFTLSNSGQAMASSIVGTAPTNIHFTFNNTVFPGGIGMPYCTSTLAAGESCTFVMSYAPRTLGTETASAVIDYDDGTAGQSLTLDLKGTGIAASPGIAGVKTEDVFNSSAMGNITNTINISLQQAAGKCIQVRTFYINPSGASGQTAPVIENISFSGNLPAMYRNWTSSTQTCNPVSSNTISSVNPLQITTTESSKYFYLDRSVVGSFAINGSIVGLPQTFTMNVNITSPPPPSATTQILWGAFYGNQGWDIPSFQKYETWVGKKASILNLFTNWNSTQQTSLFNTQLPNIWNNGNIPMITWEPYLSPNTPATASTLLSQVNAGNFDAYLNSWATSLKNFVNPDGVSGNSDDKKVYLRFAHEMNGNWYSWNANPQAYKDAWIRIRGIFVQQGITSSQVQWVWCVNVTDVGSYTAEQYYPWASQVDWVAIDGYNFGNLYGGSWINPAPLYNNMVTRMKTLAPTKPLGITEFSSTSLAGGTIAQKAQWFTDTLLYFKNNNIKMAIIFNTDKETDWAIFGGSRGDQIYNYNSTNYNVYSTYKSAMQDPAWISLTASQITQSLFNGTSTAN